MLSACALLAISLAGAEVTRELSAAEQAKAIGSALEAETEELGNSSVCLSQVQALRRRGSLLVDEPGPRQEALPSCNETSAAATAGALGAPDAWVGLPNNTAARRAGAAEAMGELSWSPAEDTPLTASLGALASEHSATTTLEHVATTLERLTTTLTPLNDLPPWQWNERWFTPESAVCATVLFVIGIISAMGGIGGGGMYVCILMVWSNLPPKRAVALSKGIVLSGAVMSWVMNVMEARRRKLDAEAAGRPEEGLMDYTVCRLVMAPTILGTLFGVLLNQYLPNWAIVATLGTTLLITTTMTAWTLFKQVREEFQLCQPTEPAEGGSVVEAPKPTVEIAMDDPGVIYKTSLYCSDILLYILVQTAVIVGGVYRYKDGNNHPWISFACIFCPTVICICVNAYYSCIVVGVQGGALGDVLLYPAVGVVVGAICGVAGIGGGIFFSPFFLWMGFAPNVAVASSSTCVLFSSNSTALQYFITGRTLVTLLVVYGIVSLFAGGIGTASILLLDRFIDDPKKKGKGKKWYITLVVFVAVALCLGLSVGQFVKEFQDGQAFSRGA